MIKKPLAIFALVLTLLRGYGQENKRLTIGDPAPDLKYSAWIKGEEIKKLASDEVYVLEFWATWCVPCMMSMPHLSKLANEYAGKVNFIGVNVMERPSAGATYSSLVPIIKEFVVENDQKMQFGIMVDTDDRHMEKQWLRRAEIRGIPATIIVKNQQVYWIGHPNFLDTVLAEVVNNTYQLEERKAKYDREMDADQIELRDYRALIGRIDSAMSNKDYMRAIKEADNAAEENTKYAYSFKQRKMEILLSHFPADSGVAYLKEQNTRSSSIGSSLSMFISTQENVSPEILKLAADILEKYDKHSTYSLDCLALMQSKIGRFEKAVTNQRQVLAWLIEGRQANPDLVSEAVITNCQKKIETYFRQSKNQNR